MGVPRVDQSLAVNVYFTQCRPDIAEVLTFPYLFSLTNSARKVSHFFLGTAFLGLDQPLVIPAYNQDS